MTVNDLIADGKTEQAAAVLYNGLLYIFNNFVPNVQLTKEEWDQVAPELVAKLETPVSEDTAEPTDAPGDDIVVAPTKADLVVKFVAGKGVTAKIPDTYKRTYQIGKKYNYTAPKVEGATADKTTLTGTMTADGVTETITYSAAEQNGDIPVDDNI